MKYTLNQILAQLEYFAGAHARIGDYSYGELSTLTNNEKTEVIYPLLHVQLDDSSVDNTYVYLQFNILLMDLVSKSDKNIEEVQSDLLLTLIELKSWFNNLRQFQQGGLKVEENASIIPFVDRFSDEVTGYNLRLKLKIKTTGSCDIPFYVEPVVDENPCDGVELPSTGFEIEGLTSNVCRQVVTYSIVDNVNADSYEWFIDGGVFQSENGNTSIDVLWTGSTGGIYVVAYYGACGEVMSEILSLTLSPARPQFSPDTLCPLSTETYSVTNYNSGNTYIWEVSGQDSYTLLNETTIEVNWGEFGGTLSVTATNDCGSDYSSVLSINCP